MEFEQVLNESFKKYKLTYIGSRKDYKIHDPNPMVLAVDEKYDVDGNGESILGINLNYYKGDKSKLIDDINKKDNEAGFRNFEIMAKLKKQFNNEKDWEIEERKRRYSHLSTQFPHMMKFIRRYKLSGIESKKRKFF